MNIDDEYKLGVVQDIAWQICGKGVVMNEGMRQNEKNIFGENWVEVLHEIAHWLVADSKYKHQGLVETSFEDELPPHLQQYKEILEEECISLILTSLLTNRLFEEEDSGYFRYLDFLYNRSSELCEEFGIGFEYVLYRAREVLNRTINKYPSKFFLSLDVYE